MKYNFMHSRTILITLAILSAAPALAEPPQVYSDAHSCEAMATMIAMEVKTLYAVYMDKRTPVSGNAQNLRDLTEAYDRMECSPADLKEQIDYTLAQWRRHG